MIVTELWIIMGHEDLVDLDEDFSEGLTLEILVIFFHHFLDEEQVRIDQGREQISVRISRSGSGYPLKMRSEVRPVVSSSIVRQLVITVVANEVRPRLVSHVVDKGKYESEYRQYLVSWNRLVRVATVVDEARE
jgi:hypothetical protein